MWAYDGSKGLFTEGGVLKLKQKSGYWLKNVHCDKNLDNLRYKRNLTAHLKVEKTPAIISETAKLTSRKFMVVLMVLFLSTTKQTRELPSRLTPTMTEHRANTTRLTIMAIKQQQFDGFVPQEV